MGKLERYMKNELDVELMACTHAFVMIFLYLMEKFAVGQDNISFLLVVEMGILGYAQAWIQKLLFWKEKVYTRRETLVRGAAWSVVPILLTVAAGQGFGWFSGLIRGGALAVCFYAFMSFYYILFRFFMRHFYRNETERLNGMLREWKKR